MTRREFQSLGSGSATPTPYRYGRQQLRREFKPLPGGVANAPCEKVNFKVFDFATGDLLWQKLLRSPLMATNGDVYSLIRGATFPVQESSATAAATTSVTLPNRSVSSSSFNGYEASWQWLEPDTGEVIGTSGWYQTLTEAVTTPDSNTISISTGIAGTLFGMKTDVHVVNAAGDLLRSSGAPRIVCHTDLSNNVAGTCKHYLEVMPITNGTMSLKMSGSVPDITATWDCADSAATVETALQTAFSGYYDSLTVTGGAINSTGLIVNVVWTNITEYFSSYGVSYSAFYDLLGNAFVRNLRTGVIGNAADTGGTSSSYLGAQCWQSETDVWRQGADPSSAVNKRMESWDASTNPWTLTWHKQPWVGKTTIDPESRGDGIPFLIDLASNGTHNAVSFQLTSNGLGGTTALMTWNASDGTGEEKYPSAASPSLAGDYPYGLTFEDGGTDIACYNRHWRDANRWVDYANLSVVASHYGSNGDDWVRMSSGSSPAVSHRLNLGDYTFFNMAGFNDTHAAFCRIGSSVSIHESRCEIMNSTGSTADSLCQTLASGPTGSGVYDPDTLDEIDQWELTYLPVTYPNNMIASTTQWRLRWTNRSDAATEVTSWFGRDETIANVDADLLTIFGTNAAANQNVSVSSLGPPTIIGTVPVYQQAVSFTAYGVKTSDEADVLETHPVFTFFAANATAALSLMPIITVEFQNFADERTAAFGALVAADRTESWARNWTAANNKNILAATLKNGLLSLFGDRVCAEAFGDLTITSVTETSTPPYDPSSNSATFDITFRNLTGVALTSLTLNKSHDGNGSLDSPTMPTTLAVGASATVTLTYSTSLDLADVDVTFYVTGTKPDATTATSATIVETVVIDPSPEEPPPP